MKTLIAFMSVLALALPTFNASATDAKSEPAAPAASASKSESKKKVSYRKTQAVDFEETDIDGQVRSPDGAYLLQKRGIQFLPLYKVNNQFEKNLLGSVEYLR